MGNLSGPLQLAPLPPGHQSLEPKQAGRIFCLHPLRLLPCCHLDRKWNRLGSDVPYVARFPSSSESNDPPNLVSASISYFKPVKVCGASSVASLPKVYWVLIALELYVFILQIVHHYTHARFRRKHNLPSFTLVKTLYNDGYIYYISVLHLRMFTCLVWEFGPGSLWYAGGQLEFSMTVALASRFHLHLRRAALGPTYTGVSYDITDQFAGKKGAKQYSMSTGTTTTATTATTTTAALDDGIPVPLSTITRSTGAGVGSLGVTMATRSGETDSSGNKREGGGEDRRIRFSYSEQRPVEVSWGQEEEGAPRRSVTLRRLSGGLFGRTKETKNVDTERRGIERSQDGRRSGSQEETVERRRISKTYFDAVPLERGDLENPPVFTTSSAPTRTETSRETGVPGNMANWNPEERVTYEFDIGWDGDSNYLKSGTKDSQHPKRGLHAVAASKIGDVLSNLGGSSSSSRHGRQDEDQIGDHRNAR
ncbi:hypothetical protein FRC15_007142 [Serendipita sp. 397]|nr:hypothetical protein FRC15_007142 [Serendipita sp. 397]